MSLKSSIEWTQATWNPTRGCSRVSAGCDNCYAERMATRFSGPGLYAEGFAKWVHGQPHWTGRVELIPNMLGKPLGWQEPLLIFVNSMSDLFHEALPFQDIDQVFAVMARCPQHTFQVLTKRADRMRKYSNRVANSRPEGLEVWPLPNVHLGVSVEGQVSAGKRIPALRATPAAVRWVSYEPALKPVNWKQWLRGIDWVVCGGESGPGARLMELKLARAVRDACEEKGVPFFFKQWGDWASDGQGGMMRVGKKKAGRVLDGRTHDDFPEEE